MYDRLGCRAIHPTLRAFLRGTGTCNLLTSPPGPCRITHRMGALVHVRVLDVGFGAAEGEMHLEVEVDVEVEAADSLVL